MIDKISSFLLIVSLFISVCISCCGNVFESIAGSVSSFRFGTQSLCFGRCIWCHGIWWATG